MTKSRRVINELEAVHGSDVRVLRERGANAVVVTGNRVELELTPGGPARPTWSLRW